MRDFSKATKNKTQITPTHCLALLNSCILMSLHILESIKEHFEMKRQLESL